MGYYSCIGHCISCRGMFSFNPHKVPSIRINDVRQPVCKRCVEEANPKRKELGLPEFVIQPGAYDAADESEWPN